MDSEQFREAAKATVDEIADYYDTIEDRRVVSTVYPGYLRELLPSTAPEQPEPWSAIQADVRTKILPGITHWQSPRFMAFFPCASSYPGLLGEMYSSAFNGAHFNWICSPAVTELETVVLDWLARACALPECYLSTSPGGGGGVIHGTASEAILTVMAAARDKYLREVVPGAAQPGAYPVDGHEPDEAAEEEMWRHRSRLVALGSGAAHSSTRKAAQVLGVRYASVPVRAEDGYAMRGDALAATLEECRAKGLEPFYLTATYGTTDTCAVDDYPGIAAALASWPPAAAGDSPALGEVWVHADAAYAGSALLCPEYQAPELAAALARFHSFNFNPHKWLMVNFDCSALWVRDRAWLAGALSAQPAYLRNRFSEAGLVTDYRDWQIPLGRRFRSLKLWFVLRAYGLEGLRGHLRSGIGLAEVLARMVAGRPDLFEVLAGPRYALLVLRVRAGRTEEERNAATRAVYEAVNAAGVVYLTSSVLNGTYAIRVATGTPAMREEHVKLAFGELVREAEKVVGEKEQP